MSQDGSVTHQDDEMIRLCIQYIIWNNHIHNAKRFVARTTNVVGKATIADGGNIYEKTYIDKLFGRDTDIIHEKTYIDKLFGRDTDIIHEKKDVDSKTLSTLSPNQSLSYGITPKKFKYIDLPKLKYNSNMKFN